MNKGVYGIDGQGNKFPINEVLKANGVDLETANNVSRALFSTQINNTVYLPELNKVIKASNQMTKNMRGNMTKLIDSVGGENQNRL